MASFEHVHSLSLDFHLEKKMGELSFAMNKGRSIDTFVKQITFQVFFLLIDPAVAIRYFLIAFDIYYALVIAIVIFTYLYLTICLAQGCAEDRRNMVKLRRGEEALK